MHTVGIPGLAALASLKRPGNTVCCAEGQEGIPGLAALASLKQRNHQLSLRLSAEDSGACCPGLIEAEGYASTNVIGERGFRGLLPWPH